MVLKTYQRRGASLQGRNIVMPEPEKKVDNIWGQALDAVSKTTAKLSQENYALGRATLINDVLNTAYEQASDNPKQFNDLIKSGFEKGLNGFDEKTKQDVYAAANEKVKMLQVKVGNNLNARLDAENTQRITNLANDALYGSSGLMAINTMLAEAIQAKDDPNKIQSLLDQRNKVSARLQSFANAKNMKGGFVIGNSKMRQAMMSPSLGMQDVILESLEDMDIEALRDYDDQTFQNKERFMEATGISSAEYKKLDKAIKDRRKLLDENDKRQMRTQGYYNAINMIYTEDQETLDNVKDIIGKDNYKELSNLMDLSNKKTFNKALLNSKDANMLGQFNSIVKVLGSKNDGTEDYPDKLLKQVISANRALMNYADQYGTDEDGIKTMKKVMIDAASNEEYASALKMLTDQQTALGKEILSHNLTFEKPERMDEVFTRNKNSGLKLKDLDLRKKEATAIASNYMAQAVAVGSAAFNMEDPEQLQAAQAAVRKIRDEGNKAIIRNNVSHIIPPAEMERLEAERANGKQALFELNGRIAEFLGFSKDGILTRYFD